MGNVIKSATTVSNGTLKRNNFLIGVNSSLELYNRALSDDEVTQNYNALKGRYGL